MRKKLLSMYESWLNWKLSAKITSAVLNVTLCSIAALVISYYVINVNREVEQVGTQWTNLGTQVLLRNAEKVNQEVMLLETLARTPSLIEAVETANAERAGWSPEYVSSKDQAWMVNDPSAQPLVNAVVNNFVSAYLIEFRAANPDEVEVFVTDIHGLNVGMTNRTSDFLQSDEDWWKSTFAGEKGATYLSEVEYDDSSAVYAMDIGVPIRNSETGDVVGILRGTVNVSTLFSSLIDMEAGMDGHIILVNSDNIVLYSQMPSFFMQPIPEAMQAILQSGAKGWAKSTDLDEHPAIVAYSSLNGEMEDALGWRVLITQHWSEVTRDVKRTLSISVLVSIMVALIGVYLCAVVIRYSIIRPIGLLTMMAKELSVGNIIHHDTEKDGLNLRQDEIGEFNQAFNRLTIYLRSAAGSATSIANKDLAVEVTPNSDRDELGNAFAKMIVDLNYVIAEFTASAESVSAAASQLAESSNQSGIATNQIAATIQQIATGTTQQSQDVNKTSAFVEQMGRAIEGIAKGSQEQAQAINKAALATTNINSAIEHVAINGRSGVQGAERMADAARSGAQTVDATIRGMQTIKSKVGLSVQKVRQMGTRSEEIDVIVDTIDEIAAQTNLLALNAAIEAARVEAKGEKTVEGLLQQHMLGAVNLVADILASGRELESKDVITLARLARLEELSISDSDGVITAASQPGSLGFRFSDNSQQQSSVFRPLLQQREGVVICPIMVRDQDGKPYIYVGVSRRDKAGIVQAGMSADLVYQLGGYSRGFAVVANEVGKLAEHAKRSTKEVAALIRDLQKTVGEAVTFMEDGARDVESGSVQAAEAGKSLEAILEIAETVSQQVKEISTAVQHMSTFSGELVNTMEMVSAVVEENTAATEEMAASSSKLTHAVENIASVSEENSAAVEEVSAATEEVLAQVDQVATSAALLMEMARESQKLVAQYRLAIDHRCRVSERSSG